MSDSEREARHEREKETAMRVEKSDRGFQCLTHPSYLEPHEAKRVVSQSSAIGDYDDSLDYPGSSFLWVGDHHHLNREEVRGLRDSLTMWLLTGSLD